MPRPSIRKRRAEEILEAYEQCIALYGVDGATQKRIATHAGMARPLLRHHVGNNNELLLKATQRFITRSQDKMDICREIDYQTPIEFLEYLFLSESDEKDITIASSLIIAAQTQPDIQNMMKEWLENIEDIFLSVLSPFYPRISRQYLKMIIDGIIGLLFHAGTFSPLKEEEPLKNQSFEAAKVLLESLPCHTI